MLIGPSIRGIAPIDRLCLDLEAGLNVMPGEIGAGPSILLDAPERALGAGGTEKAHAAAMSPIRGADEIAEAVPGS